jgi:hypothetical protein
MADPVEVSRARSKYFVISKEKKEITILEFTTKPNLKRYLSAQLPGSVLEILKGKRIEVAVKQTFKF